LKSICVERRDEALGESADSECASRPSRNIKLPQPFDLHDCIPLSSAAATQARGVCRFGLDAPFIFSGQGDWRNDAGQRKSAIPK
jgi:hypothetical protein